MASLASKYSFILGHVPRAPWGSPFSRVWYRDKFNNDPSWFLTLQYKTLTFQIKRSGNTSLGRQYWWDILSPKRVKDWVSTGIGIKGTVWVS